MWNVNWGMKSSVEWEWGNGGMELWNGIGVGVEWEWKCIGTYLKSVYPISGDHLTVKDF